MIDLAKLTGETLIKLNLATLDPEMPHDDAMAIGQHIAREAEARGWTDGWYEDPSVLSEDQRLGRRGAPRPEAGKPPTPQGSGGLPVVTCPECKGGGTVREQHGRYWEEDGGLMWKDVPCPFCNGKRMVPDDTRLAVYRARGGMAKAPFRGFA